jgi:hypothetical protein
MSMAYLRPLGFGETLDGAFSVYRRNFASMFLAALIPTVPVAFVFLALGSTFARIMTSQGTEGGGSIAVLYLLLLVSWSVSSTLTWGSLTYMASEAYAGRRAPLGDAFRVAVARGLPLFGASFLMMLLAGFGFLFFIVPGFIVLSIFCLIAPTAVLEKQGAVDALGRSRDLTSGALGYTFGLMFVAYLIAALPGLIITAGNTFLTFGLNPGAAMQASFVASALSMVVNALTLPFTVGVVVMFYYDRRVRNEALDVQMAAERLAMA